MNHEFIPPLDEFLLCYVYGMFGFDGVTSMALG